MENETLINMEKETLISMEKETPINLQKGTQVRISIQSSSRLKAKLKIKQNLHCSTSEKEMGTECDDKINYY